MIPFAQASGHVIAAQDLVFRINDVFLFPLIALLSAVAFIVFLYGAFAYVRNAASQEGRQTGQRHLLYGLVGLLVMFSAFTILQIAAGTFGIETGPPTSSVRPEARPEIWNRAPEVTTDVIESVSGDTSSQTMDGWSTSAADENSGFDRNDQSVLTQPYSDSAVVPGGLTNPNPNPDDTVVDTSSENPRYPVIDTRSNQAKEISCNNEMGCTGAIQSCTGADHNGVYSGVIGHNDEYGQYILCEP